MPAWRCPHCGAQQPETARCWVCQRSTTCCATCRHFRRAVASGLGYCGLDRRRRPLHGDEMRDCWAGGVGPLLADTSPLVTVALVPERHALAFVPVEELATVAHPVEQTVAATSRDRPDPERREPVSSLGWTLWGDAFL